jgi:hypothetical protein
MFRKSLALAAVLLLSLVVTSYTRAADLETYLPKDTDLVLSLNVRQVLESPVVKNNAIDLIRTTLNSNREVEASIKALGLDPLVDFNRVSIGINLENFNNPRATAILDGKFDSVKISRLMDELIKKDPKQFGAEKSGGKVIYRIAVSNQIVFATVIDAGTIVLGTVKENIVSAAVVGKGSRKPEIRKELAELLARADPMVSLYLAGHVKGRLGAVPLPDADLKKMIEQIETIAGEVRLDKDLQAVVTLTTSSAQIAKEVQSLAESAISLYRLQLKLALSDQPELRPLVDLASSIKAVQKDKQIVITGNLAGAGIEKLLKPEKK